MNKRTRQGHETRGHRFPGSCVSSSPRRSAAQTARARRSELAERLRREHEAARWFSEQDSLDHGAVGRCAGWQALVEWFADWQADRLSSRPPRPGTAHHRTTRLGCAASSACLLCEHPPCHLLFESQLRALRPGTDHPFCACGANPPGPVTPPSACALSHVGELEADHSIVAAWAPREDLIRQHLLRRTRQLLELDKRIRKRQVVEDLRRAQARRGEAA